MFFRQKRKHFESRIPPPQPVRKVGISKYNLSPARLWKGWNRLMRHFSDGLPLKGNLFCRIQHLYLNNIEAYETLP